jgi:hypothetical protein
MKIFGFLLPNQSVRMFHPKFLVFYLHPVFMFVYKKASNLPRCRTSFSNRPFSKGTLGDATLDLS